MNKIAVFGASGATGSLFTELALQNRYCVKALVRNPSKLVFRHPDLDIIEGDVLDAEKVKQTVQSTEAVISLVAQKKDSRPDLRKKAMQNILYAMQQNDVKRLIILSSLPYELQLGFLDPNDKPGSMHQFIMFIGKNPLLNNFMMFLLKNLVGAPVVTAKEYIDPIERIKHSELDWTIVRTPRLENKPPQGKYRLGYLDANTRMSIARADVAAFLLDELTSPQYIRKMPVISY
jgi:putative NADH-flavin reductase